MLTLLTSKKLCVAIMLRRSGLGVTTWDFFGDGIEAVFVNFLVVTIVISYQRAIPPEL